MFSQQPENLKVVASDAHDEILHSRIGERPDITPELLDHVIAEGEILKGEPEARTTVLFFAASIVAALGGMESVLAERHRGTPINHLDLPFGRCLCDRFSRKVLLVSSKTTQNDCRRTKRRSDPRRSAIERINRIVKERTPFKPMKEQLRQLPWKLIFILALIQLTRPILSTAGFFDDFRPQGPIIATALIALIWVGVVVI